MSKKDLDLLEKRLKLDLKKQAQIGLAEIFDLLSCKAIAGQIKKGRKVTENAEFGIRLCVHNKVAPRVDPKTLKFYPMSRRGKELEKKFIDKTNMLLESGGFSKMSPNLISNLRKKDKEFEREIAKRRKELRK